MEFMTWVKRVQSLTLPPVSTKARTRPAPSHAAWILVVSPPRDRLDWWANSATLLGSIGVSLVITARGSGWEAHGCLTHEEDREELAFFCDLDPVFTLRLDDRSTIAVIVHPTDGHRRFSLNEYTGADPTAG